MYNIFKYNIQLQFIYKIFVNEYTLESIIRQQYEMSKRGISLTESSNLPLFEFDTFSDLAIKDATWEAQHPNIAEPT